MPHRVTAFLRPVSGITAKAPNDSSRPRPGNSNTSAESSDAEDHAAVKMHDFGLPFKTHKRLSKHFGSKPAAAAPKDSHPQQHTLFHHNHFHHSSPAPVALDWSIESPPIVFHGNAESSSGALVSGLMYLDVREETAEVDSFTATLRIHTTQKKPFHAHCFPCQNQYQQLKTWTFVAAPAVLPRGRHQYPFSILLPGDLPASMDSPLMSIAYEFTAEASYARSPCVSTSSIGPVKFERTLDVKRSIPAPENPHHSVRVFPPTNIKTTAEYSSVMHPLSVNKMSLRLDGLTSPADENNAVDVWKLKKVTWRLEETIKTKAPGCKPHAIAATSVPEDADNIKSLQRTEVRTLGEKHLLQGWKSDYNQQGGNVDLEFDFFLHKQKPNSRDLKFVCDTKTASGTDVSHSLLIELIVSKEHGHEGKTEWATPTGTGRILRMHFNVIVTDYPGLGVSWDNETPPVYQDVPPSPPSYPDECPEYPSMPGSPVLNVTSELLDADTLHTELQYRSSTDSLAS
ncbi:hypothetical protein S40293_00872 [Stachybotrys chartarum IBT 40293]|nr:hypothetical protein S40293_00872 [Stachybotrys chartarum IBT 40293]